MKPRLCLILIATLILTGSIFPGVAQQIDPASIEAFARAKMQAFGIPGLQICVTDRVGRTIVDLSLGYADPAKRRPLDSRTQLKIGSNTKSFTAFAILILAQRGQIGLDDPVGHYLGIGPNRFRDVTIRQLMNMNSGLRGYVNDDDEDRIIDRIIAHPDRPIPPETLLQHAFELTDQLGATPAGTFHYTNTNYILLGMIIEQVSGSSYADFIQRELIAPYGLAATYVPVGNDYDANVSKGYHFDRSENTTDDYSALDLSYVWSAGAVISTASDLCRWIRLIGTDALVDGPVAADVRTGLPISDSAQYTAGLIQEPDFLWHNGTVLGYHSEMRYLKRSGIAIAALSNCTLAGVEADPVKEIVEEITRQVNGDI